MIIGGFKKLSLIDYPEHIACIIFTRGCNLRCPYCHNPELVEPDRFDNGMDISVEDILRFLEGRRGLLDGVCITGGEPTLHGDLAETITKIMSMGFGIKLDTNGSRPEVLRDLIDGKLLDYVAMDVKVPLERYASSMGFSEDPANIGKSIGILKENFVDYEFRTTVVPGIHSYEDMEKIGRTLEGAKKFYIQNFRASKHIDRTMTDLKGFPEAELLKFRDILCEYIDTVEIRN